MKAFAGKTQYYQEGMDLRDYFAAKAMQGFFASGYYGGKTDITVLAKNAYLLANEMMKARENKHVN